VIGRFRRWRERRAAFRGLNAAIGRAVDRTLVEAGLLSQCPMCLGIYNPDEESHYVTERPIASGVQCIRVSLPSR